MQKFNLWLCASLLATTATSQALTQSATPPVTPETNTAQVQALLAKMSQVPAHLNYRGTFTYQNQNSIGLQSFSVEHWVENGQEHDRLLLLNGPERAIVRDGQPVDCKAMGDKLLQGNFASIGGALSRLGDFYQFEMRSPERVAGRSAQVLQVIPKDLYRYAYILSIDEETGLVLKSWLIDETARPMERYQFVSIELNPDITQLSKIKAPAHQRKAVADVTGCNPTSVQKPSSWQVKWVPPGFAFAGERKLSNGQDMLMYTDGLTTFSIFLEPTTSFVPEGTGRRGATLAYMSRLIHNNTIYRVSVVGEIPAIAAREIAQNIAAQ
jgi:sigma-E factor negative regulatory protein RseB